MIAFVIPAFLIFVALEYWVSCLKKKNSLFDYEGSITNISVGIAERLLNLFIAGSFYTLYETVYYKYALFSIPNHWWVWVLLLLTTDLIWYWYHRLGHEVNLFWAAHIVHHQSEQFNYTVSARITTLQSVIRNLFWLTLPWLGFHPSMVITILVVHGAYSFFTHTQLVGRLGWLEHIFITPSHHGVHHASNEKYLDKNYGDIFIFWDKLFGTFQAEEERPVFGISQPLRSKSFLWQHFHFFFEIAEACRRSKSFFKSIQIIFGKPSQLDGSIRNSLEKYFLPSKSFVRSTLRLKVYINCQIVFCLAGVLMVTLFFEHLTSVDKIFFVAIILLTLINCGAILEQNGWVFKSELVRAMICFTYISIERNSLSLFAFSFLAVLIISMTKSFKQKYFVLIYG